MGTHCTNICVSTLFPTVFTKILFQFQHSVYSEDCLSRRCHTFSHTRSKMRLLSYLVPLLLMTACSAFSLSSLLNSKDKAGEAVVAVDSIEDNDKAIELNKEEVDAEEDWMEDEEDEYDEEDDVDKEEDDELVTSNLKDDDYDEEYEEDEDEEDQLESSNLDDEDEDYEEDEEDEEDTLETNNLEDDDYDEDYEEDEDDRQSAL